MSAHIPAPLAFNQLDLSENVLLSVEELGYESPTPVQAEAIPVLLAGRDLIAQAQTGTGKTAAFALPLLGKINIAQRTPQVLVLTPTRELAIQVAEAFKRYASHLQGLRVLPVYGGQDYGIQLRALKYGVHVIVGTPGRIMDHMRRETLVLDGLRCLVLDEADEMLRMGFIDDVQWLLERMPAQRQTALFSATIPAPIRAIAKRYLREPEQISIRLKTTTAATIRQRYWPVSGLHKLDALTRILEAEDTEGVLIFVRTKIATVELAERLEARGFASGAINGDMAQSARERTIEHLKRGKLNILVATDVAARGLDVERVSHVINYDIPYDTEAYVHRIGRTGRAGRHGDAILFVASRETRMLRLIEQATRQPIERMTLPSAALINERRCTRFMQRISDALGQDDLEPYTELVMRYQREHQVEPIEIAAALARVMQGDIPLLLPTAATSSAKDGKRGAGRSARPGERSNDRAGERQSERFDARHGVRPSARPSIRPNESDLRAATDRSSELDKPPQRSDSRSTRPAPANSEPMQSYRVEVGRTHGLKPGNLVGAIANEAGLEACFIGRIEIHDTHSTVVLPEGMPNDILNHLKRVWVAGQQLRMSRSGDQSPKIKSGGKARAVNAKPGKTDRPRRGKKKPIPQRA